MVATRARGGAPALTGNARTVLERRYLLRDAGGALAETPEGLFARVAAAVAAAEPTPALRGEWAGRFGEELAALRFLPNSPTLMNAGAGSGTLAACFVLPVEDSMESIMSTARAAAMVQKYGGGTGFDFSRLRPEGDSIASTHGAACGPVSVLRHYDDVSRLVTQGGKRDGANMGILRVDHPDVRAFVHAKDGGASAPQPPPLQRFNLSLAVTDGFMAAAASGGPFAFADPRTGEPRGEVDAAALLGEAARSAWRSGDPGMVFLDAINRDNPTPALGAIEATNPCGEVPLLPWEACTLGSVHVALFRDAASGRYRWDALAETVAVAVRFLDDVIDASPYPLPEIASAVRGNRKIGLGVMGFHDLLIAEGVPYDSAEALALAGRLMGAIREAADEASAALGEEKGAFPNIGRSIYADGPRYRNAARTCVAPTGTIAIVAGASPGIEPLYSLAHVRRMGDGTALPEVPPAFEEAARAGGFHSPALMADLAAGGSLAEQEAVPEAERRRFATAHEIGWESHLAMQAAFQRHTDLAVSKTVNLPHGADADEVRAIFVRAHELGCKGVTVYRDGSRARQVLERAPAADGGGAAPGPACPDCGAPLGHAPGRGAP